jgi:hypothetical protein
MRFYEVLVLAPTDMEASELQARSENVAEQVDAKIEILSATVHARMQEGTGKHGGTVFVVDIGEDEDSLYEFSGAFARMHEELVINFTELDDETLSLKGNRQDVADFLNSEYDINVTVEDDGDKVAESGEDDDDTFTIDMPDDLHG